ncbi:MAG: DUF2232 domain-containing protein [Pseudomonadota bacterium]|nr:DUF2232 domain-containing protein [Pseudomonadota bacterium]
MFTPKQWLAIAAGGFFSASLYALALTGNFGGLLLAVFYQLPVFLIGLSMGTVAGAFAGACAAAGMLVIFGALGFLVFVLFNAAPVIIMIRQALLSRADENEGKEWYSSGLLAAYATGLALVLLTGAFLWLGATTEGIQAAIEEFLGAFADKVLAGVPAAQRAQVVDSIAPILPGAIGLYWIVTLVVNGALGQGLLVRFGYNLRPSPDFSAMHLPRWLRDAAAILLIGAIALPGVFGFYAVNAAILVSLPFFLIGLAVVHVAAKRVATGSLLLIVFYILMILFGWPVVFVAFLGLIEQIAGFRRKLANAGEEE